MLVTLRAYDTSGLVHNIAYMIDPTTEVYDIIFMCVLSSCVSGHMDFERVIPLTMGTYSLLDYSMLNLFSILSMYVDCERPSNLLDLSL